MGTQGPSFREVFDGHVRFVWRSLLALGVAERDVPDASQQVFLVVHDKLRQLAPGCSPRTFVYGICLRIASNFRRRAHVRRETLVDQVPEDGGPATQEDRVSHRESLTRLRATLDRMADTQREVFVLYELEELTMAEVAEAVGCPLQTAYSRLHAARKLVGAAFAQDEERDVARTRSST